jgi:hypothetical protein
MRADCTIHAICFAWGLPGKCELDVVRQLACSGAEFIFKFNRGILPEWESAVRLPNGKKWMDNPNFLPNNPARQ